MQNLLFLLTLPITSCLSSPLRHLEKKVVTVDKWFTDVVTMTVTGARQHKHWHHNTPFVRISLHHLLDLATSP